MTTTPDTGILAASCERHLPAMLAFLERMVRINSFTLNPAGVNQVAAVTAAGFEELGFSATSIPSARSDFGSHLVLKRNGKINAPTIALVSHLDTVFTEEEEQRNAFHWRPAGSRIYGPGTNDIKGGTALIWLMLIALRDSCPREFEETNWTVLLNASEEVTSGEFGDLCRRELPVKTAACLVFEGDGGSGDEFSIVAARKGRATFDVHVSGRGSHAGSDHQGGANAAVQLARLVTSMDALTNYAAEVTVNVGTLRGGTVCNRVPHEAFANLEMRAFSPEIFERTRDQILSHAGLGEVKSSRDGYACRVQVAIRDECGPWPENEQTERLIAIWQNSAAELGLPIAREHRGGLSDGNVLWSDFPTVDGLGPRGASCHCSEHSDDGSKEQEWADLTSFVPKALLNATAILQLLKDTGQVNSR